jgi:hypothetical protein
MQFSRKQHSGELGSGTVMLCVHSANAVKEWDVWEDLHSGGRQHHHSEAQQHRSCQVLASALAKAHFLPTRGRDVGEDLQRLDRTQRRQAV